MAKFQIDGCFVLLLDASLSFFVFSLMGDASLSSTWVTGDTGAVIEIYLAKLFGFFISC